MTLVWVTYVLTYDTMNQSQSQVLPSDKDWEEQVKEGKYWVHTLIQTKIFYVPKIQRSAKPSQEP